MFERCLFFFFTSVREKKTRELFEKRFTKHNIRGVRDFPWKFFWPYFWLIWNISDTLSTIHTIGNNVKKLSSENTSVFDTITPLENVCIEFMSLLCRQGRENIHLAMNFRGEKDNADNFKWRTKILIWQRHEECHWKQYVQTT